MTPIGIIGGTALPGLAGADNAAANHPETRYGPTSGPLIRTTLGGCDVCFIMRHGSGHRLAPHRINYRANIQALADAGVQQVVAMAAVGGITQAMRPRRIVIPDQLIDYTWGRAHTFYDQPEVGLNHIDFTSPYSEPMRQVLIQQAESLALDAARSGVHGVTQGPRLETAAEINRMEHDGCDIVGMTGMPEAALAREAGFDYTCCALVVNAAAGRGDGAIHAEIETTLARGMADIERLLQAVLPVLADK